MATPNVALLDLTQRSGVAFTYLHLDKGEVIYSVLQHQGEMGHLCPVPRVLTITAWISSV